MTAVATFIGKDGVAIAADSAVTISAGGIPGGIPGNSGDTILNSHSSHEINKLSPEFTIGFEPETTK